MPFNEYFAPYDKDRQAIMYALARQETRFVPASISPAFALGMMQIMPFLTNHLCKERCEDIDLDEMFKPSVAVSYANQHLDYLYKTLTIHFISLMLIMAELVLHEVFVKMRLFLEVMVANMSHI